MVSYFLFNQYQYLVPFLASFSSVSLIRHVWCWQFRPLHVHTAFQIDRRNTPSRFVLKQKFVTYLLVPLTYPLKSFNSKTGRSCNHWNRCLINSAVARTTEFYKIKCSIRTQEMWNVTVQLYCIFSHWPKSCINSLSIKKLA